MSQVIDISGRKFGDLIVIERRASKQQTKKTYRLSPKAQGGVDLFKLRQFYKTK